MLLWRHAATAIDQYPLTAGPTAANLLQWHVAARWHRQADRYIDPALHTTWAVLTK